MRKAIPVFFLLWSSTIFSQEKSTPNKEIDPYNDTLKVIIKKLYSSNADSTKHHYNKQLIKTFDTIFKMTGSFIYPYDSIKEIGFLMSPDKTFRIINWNIPLSDGTHEYYGFIHAKYTQVRKKK